MTETFDKKTRAGFWPRVAAFLLDRLILGAVFLPIRLIGGFDSALPVFFTYTKADLAAWALSAAYFALFTIKRGATPGKAAMHLRVVAEDGSEADRLTILLRETAGRYLSGLLCIGYIMAAADGENRALHDRLFDTRVVADYSRAEKKKKKPATAAEKEAADWYAPNIVK